MQHNWDFSEQYIWGTVPKTSEAAGGRSATFER
jgi:hypothetical protein